MVNAVSNLLALPTKWYVSEGDGEEEAREETGGRRRREERKGMRAILLWFSHLTTRE